MKLVCKNAFGNFKPGDEVEVPDGAVFDGTYFEVKQAPKPAPERAPVKESE
jgi:hypothetical protein